MKGSIAAGVVLLATAGVVFAQDEVTKEALAAAHGIDQWDSVTAVRFTFHVKSKNGETNRQWYWEPKTGLVRVEADGETVSYNRNDLAEAPEQVVTADQRWINDTYWLMWPLHLSWSEEARLSEGTGCEDPLSGAGRLCATITYPAEGGGYTPGDSYRLYLDRATMRPTAWQFFRGGAAEPSLTTSWEEYRQAGPLVLSTLHQNADGSFRMEMRDLAVRTVDSGGEWIEARPVADGE